MGVVLPAQLDCIIPTAKARGFAQLQFPSVVGTSGHGEGGGEGHTEIQCRGSFPTVSWVSDCVTFLLAAPGRTCSASDLCRPHTVGMGR